MKILILGVGCPKCKTLMANVEEAVKELNLQAEIEKVTEIQEIVTYGVLSTPGLVVDGTVVSAGKVLNVDEIKTILTRK
jgi:small redox-active disulfide protein 2